MKKIVLLVLIALFVLAAAPNLSNADISLPALLTGLVALVVAVRRQSSAAG